MSLSDSRVGATIAVSDFQRARSFYEGKLGLSPQTEMPGGDGNHGAVVYACGDGTGLFIYSSEHAGTNKATAASWEVDDLDALVDELSSAGVEFETYDEPLKTDERGIHSMGETRIAWFKDPDGNIISVGQFG